MASNVFLGVISLCSFEAKVISNPTSQSMLSPIISVHIASSTKLAELTPDGGHGELWQFFEEQVYALEKQK